jgi:hypothetical protein
MERERQHMQRREAGGGGAGPDASLDEHRERLQGMASAVDKVLAGIDASQAEEYLQQSKQKPAQ